MISAVLALINSCSGFTISFLRAMFHVRQRTLSGSTNSSLSIPLWYRASFRSRFDPLSIKLSICRLWSVIESARDIYSLLFWGTIFSTISFWVNPRLIFEDISSFLMSSLGRHLIVSMNCRNWKVLKTDEKIMSHQICLDSVSLVFRRDFRFWFFSSV